MKDTMLIEKCPEVYDQWQEIPPSPRSCATREDNDFQTIVLSVKDGFRTGIE